MRKSKTERGDTLIEKRWVGGTCGHWEIYKDGKFIASCDDNELEETLREAI